MEKQENDNSSEENEERDILLLSSNIDDEKYIIKIYISKNNTTIIFKIEQEKIQNYYFYEKFDLRDLRQKDKEYILIDSLKGAYIKLKELIKNSSILLEKKSSTIEIKFLNKLKILLSFNLRKKLVSQKRLNLLLIKKIQNNNDKLKEADEQITKIDKTLEKQKLSFKGIYDNISKINNSLSNIENSINEIKNINLKFESDCNIEKEKISNKIPKNTNEIFKNKNNDKNFKNNDTISKNKNENNIKNKFDKKNISGNLIEKKLSKKNNNQFQMIISCNLIGILIAIYLIYLVNLKSVKIKSNKIINEKFQKILSVLKENSRDKMDFLKNIRKIKEYKNQKQTKLIEEENKILNLKTRIINHFSIEAKNINFHLKFSTNILKNNKFFNFENMSNCLILIKFKTGKEIYFFFQNNNELLKLLKIEENAKIMLKNTFIKYFDNGNKNVFLDGYFNDFDDFINIFKYLIVFSKEKQKLEVIDIKKELLFKNHIEILDKIEVYEIQYIYADD